MNLDMDHLPPTTDKTGSSFVSLRTRSTTSAASSESAPRLLLREQLVAFWQGVLLLSWRAAAVSIFAAFDAPAPSHSQPSNLAIAELMKPSCSERAKASATFQVVAVSLIAVMS